MYALTETKWKVESAIKLLLLRQLMSVSAVDADGCKRALLMSEFNLDHAANYLIANPPDQDSPEIIHV